jgi:hypothetical protein
MQIVLPLMKEKFPLVERFIIQSDNASCLSSLNHIAFLNEANKYWMENLKFWVSRWIYTEAQTGKTYLDTHFAYINKKVERYVKGGKDVTIEKELVEALSSNDGLPGAAAVLVKFVDDTPNKLFSKDVKINNVGSRSTHDILFRSDQSEVKVFKCSDITEPVTIPASKLNASALAVPFPFNFCKIETVFHSSRECMHKLLKEVSREHVRDDDTSAKKRKRAPQVSSPPPSIIKQRIMNNCTVHRNASNAFSSRSVSVPCDIFGPHQIASPPPPGWAEYRTKKDNCELQMDTIEFLWQEYRRGVGREKSKNRASPYSTSEAFDKLPTASWLEKFRVTISRIKAFFGSNADAMKKIEEALTINIQRRASVDSSTAAAVPSSEGTITAAVVPPSDVAATLSEVQLEMELMAEEIEDDTPIAELAMQEELFNDECDLRGGSEGEDEEKQDEEEDEDDIEDDDDIGEIQQKVAENVNQYTKQYQNRRVRSGNKFVEGQDVSALFDGDRLYYPVVVRQIKDTFNTVTGMYETHYLVQQTGVADSRTTSSSWYVKENEIQLPGE